MLKNLFLNTSAIRYAPDDEGKSAAELEREQIALTELPPAKVKKEGEETEEAEPEAEEVEEETETEEVEPEAPVEETAEAKAIREAAEAAGTENKTARQIARMQKRIDTLTAKATTTDTENAELKKLLDAKQKDGDLVLTEDEVERRAELKAQEKVNERQFQNAVNTLAKDANKLDKDFNKNINTVTAEIGLLPPVMIGILEDLESEHTEKKVGAEVLVYLSKNVDEYEDIYRLSEGRMALKLQQLANKITKKAARPISQVPAPNEPIGGKGGAVSLNDKMSDADWIAARERETGGGFRKKA